MNDVGERIPELAWSYESNSDNQSRSCYKKGAQIEQATQRTRMSNREESAGNQERGRNRPDANRPHQPLRTRRIIHGNLKEQSEQC